MAVIGVIDIAMRATTDKFTGGINTARKSLGSLARDAGGRTLGAIGTVMGKAGIGAVNLAKKVGGLATQLAKMGAVAAGGAAAGLLALTLAQMPAIDANAKLADRVGTTTQKLAGLQLAANLGGGPVGQLPEIMGKFAGTLGAAARGATPAGAAIRRLGLDAKDLAKMDAVDAVGAIADGMKELSTPAERAAVATQIFGEQGIKLANTLAGGSEALRKAAAEADAYGLAVSRVDAAKVENANDAITRAKGVIEGVGTQLAVQLAPFIDAASAKFTGMAVAGGGVGPIVAKGLQYANTAIGFVADATQYLKTAFYGVQSAVTKSISTAVKAISGLGKAVAWVINLIPGMEVSFGETLDAVSADLDKLAADQLQSAKDEWAKPPASEGINKFFDEITSSAQASAEAVAASGEAMKGLGDDAAETAFRVGELESKLHEQVAAFGLSSDQAEIYKLKQDGATASDLARGQRPLRPDQDP